MFALQNQDQTRKLPEGKSARGDCASGERGAPAYNPVWQSLATRPVSVQPKLSVSPSDDPHEREADRIAERVTRAPAIQRACAACSDGGASCPKCVEEGVRVQRRVGASSDSSAVSVPDGFARGLGPGRPLDPSTRAEMENSFGQDFGHVRVHTDARAAESARSVNALAYTSGRDVVFGAAQYAPQSAGGRRLLAHELTHVVQQRDGQGPPRIQRWAVKGCKGIQETYVDDAVTRAHGDLSNVLPKVGVRPVTEAVKDALWLAFRDNSDATADLALNNVRRLKEQITGTRFACVDRVSDDECKGETVAHAPIGKPAGTVSICRPQFFAGDMTMFAQSETVIHEAAHMYLSMKDHGYFAAPTNLCSETPKPKDVKDPGARESGTAGDNPAYRLENADSYGCFVHYLRYVSGDERHKTAEGYRGANLSIKSEDGLNTIFTRAFAPQLRKFSIAGLPSNSGFRFRWKLHTDKKDYDPTPLGGGANAAAFDEANAEVYFPNALATRIWNDGVRHAKLVCEVEIYGAHGDKYAPPIITKETNVTVEDSAPPPV